MPKTLREILEKFVKYCIQNPYKDMPIPQAEQDILKLLPSGEDIKNTLAETMQKNKNPIMLLEDYANAIRDKMIGSLEGE